MSSTIGRVLTATMGVLFAISLMEKWVQERLPDMPEFGQITRVTIQIFNMEMQSSYCLEKNDEKIFLIYFYLCECMWVCVCMNLGMWSPWLPEVSIGFPGAGVIAGCELPAIGVRNQTHCPLSEQTSSLFYSTISPPPKVHPK